MMPGRVPWVHAFLIGGGREDTAVLASHRPFVAALGDAPVVACLALDEPERWSSALRAAGAAEVRMIQPPERPRLAGCAGVYVAGGLTPAYQEWLAADPSWLSGDLVYAGFSAGSAIAGRRALVGGWRAMVDGVEVAVIDEEAGEDLETVTVRDGLAVVDALIDVHAAQWGTLGRLCHAVLAEGSDGWAIDEGTCTEFRDGAFVAVHGNGAAAHVTPAGDGTVSVSFAAASRG
jgi:cyanophycinase